MQYNTTFYESPVVLVSVHHSYDRKLKTHVPPENNIITAWVEVRYLLSSTSRGGGGGGTGVHFSGMIAAGISEPLPHYSLFLVYFVANYKPPIYLFFLDFLHLKVPKKYNPILIILLKMIEKATPLQSAQP